jgi:integrase
MLIASENPMEQRKIGNLRGQKKAFTAAQAADLSDRLIADASRPYPNLPHDREIRDAALFRVALCSMLRASDVLNLRLKDVWSERGAKPKAEFTIIQKKTKQPITCYLSEVTIEILWEWIAYDFGSALYTDPKVDAPELIEKVQNYKIFGISDRQYRNIVQAWAKRIGLDPKFYSTHSLRRTKAKEIYAQHKNIEAIRIALGHKSIETTKVYLGVEQDEVEHLIRKTKIGE